MIVTLALGVSAQLGCSPERPAREALGERAALREPERPDRGAAPDAPSPASALPSFTPPDANGYGRAGALRYLEQVVGGARPEQALPMVVVIHGLGDRPGLHWLDLVQLHEPARVIMPEAPTPYLDGFSWFPFRARGADPKELAAGIGRAAELLADSLAILARQRPTRGLPLVTGFSQGGMLSFALALRHPERLGLAVPISGALPAPLWPSGAPAKGTPKIVALHGTVDELVPFEPTKQLVAQLRARGYDATLLSYEGVGHQISDAMRERVSSQLHEALSAAQTAL